MDYQLLPPATGHDILSDIRDFFSYIRNPEATFKTEVGNSESRVKIDVNAIAVAGASAGGLCAYLAAIAIDPKPKAVLSMYGMGGDFLASISISCVVY